MAVPASSDRGYPVQPMNASGKRNEFSTAHKHIFDIVNVLASANGFANANSVTAAEMK